MNLELEKLLPTLNALPADAVHEPQFPVATALQEAFDTVTLLHGQAAVVQRLLAVGLERQTLDALGPAHAAALAAQSRWVNLRNARKNEDLKELEAVATATLTHCLAACRWNLRDDRVALGTIAAISEGEGIADLIQDLSDTAYLLETRAAAFARDTSFDASRTAIDLRSTAERLRLGTSHERLDAEQLQARDLRNRAYTYLDDLLDTIREAGRYAYKDDATMRLRFGSAYLRQRRRTLRQRAAAAPTP